GGVGLRLELRSGRVPVEGTGAGPLRERLVVSEAPVQSRTVLASRMLPRDVPVLITERGCGAAAVGVPEPGDELEAEIDPTTAPPERELAGAGNHGRHGGGQDRRLAGPELPGCRRLGPVPRPSALFDPHSARRVTTVHPPLRAVDIPCHPCRAWALLCFPARGEEQADECARQRSPDQRPIAKVTCTGSVSPVRVETARDFAMDSSKRSYRTPSPTRVPSS